MILDLIAERIIATRRVEGSVNSVTMQPTHSYVTSLTFSPEGAALYLGCGRGLLHALLWETEPAKLAAVRSSLGRLSPIRESFVVFGEDSSLIGDGARAIKKWGGQAMRGFDDLAAKLGIDVGEEAEAARAAAAAAAAERLALQKPRFVSLHYSGGSGGGGAVGEAAAAQQQHQQQHQQHQQQHPPMLLALDSNNRLRCLHVPSAEVLAASGLTTGLAGQMMGAGIVGELAEGGDVVAQTTLAGIKVTRDLVKGALNVSMLGLAQGIMGGGTHASERLGYVAYVEKPVE